MAYVEFHERDCSTPYKKFQELENGDFIFMIDYKNLSIDKYEIKDVQIEKVKEHDWRKNCYEVMMKIIGYDHEYPQRISDGNCFIETFYKNGEETFFTTDERIAESIIDLMKQRNHYQWNCLTGIFGSPMNKYATKDIKLN